MPVATTRTNFEPCEPFSASALVFCADSLSEWTKEVEKTRTCLSSFTLTGVLVPSLAGSGGGMRWLLEMGSELAVARDDDVSRDTAVVGRLAVLGLGSERL